MAEVMRKNGLTVIGTDIETGTDYLTASLPESDVSWIITNPPFSIADGFIERSYEHCLPFALLLKTQFWHARKRYDMFAKNRPAYILPLTWRPDFMFKQRGKGSPLMDVTWTVWIPGNHKSAYIPLKKPVTSP